MEGAIEIRAKCCDDVMFFTGSSEHDVTNYRRTQEVGA